MQVILLLLSLFLIACVLYGIYSGVRAIVCSTTRFTQNSCTSALSMDELEITKKDSDRIPSEPYHGINELKTALLHKSLSI